ncbi:MAG: SDR family oxidoreductase [Glaciecola sp.]|nr:SDR family oxidoreductase [Glaciecola sp.]MDG1817019.1 SDR family oxidoreductase [Glaciecola sp.]MDG2099471.1 SDR family oxidoreductase [Glaciecola sp.]
MTITAVTGSASGIGAAVCKQLQAAGHTIIGIDRQQADIIADLSTVDGRIHAAEQVKALSNNKLDGLVCCAGLGVTAPSASLVVSVNYFGSTELIALLQDTLAQGEHPAITIIGSVAAVQQIAEPHAMTELMLANKEADARAMADEIDQPQIAYSASKYALTVHARRLAVQIGNSGIRLNTVAPGAVETPLHEASKNDPRFGEAVRNFVAPIGRNGEPSEIADAVSFLQSQQASFVHGSVLYVDGGMDAMMRNGKL